jgi:hypothetical protein
MPSTTLARVVLLQISDCLARVVRALADVASEAQRRRPLVDAITEMETARAEARWLRTYESDANRFKVGLGHVLQSLLYHQRCTAG